MKAKHARFVAEYLVDLNATQAAIRAGYSPKTAHVIGPRLLGNVAVSAAIQEGQAKRLKKLDITAERVLSEMATIAFSDIRNVFDDRGNLRLVNELPDDVAPAIASVEVARERVTRLGDGDSGIKVEECVIKVRAWDKVKALELLAKNLGLLKDRLQLEGMPMFRIVKDDGDGNA